MKKNAEHTLAEIALYGSPAGPAPWEGYTMEQVERARVALAQARAYGRAWHWRQAEAALDRAYTALGAENPGSGYAWHIGRHPLQVAMQSTMGDAE